MYRIKLTNKISDSNYKVLQLFENIRSAIDFIERHSFNIHFTCNIIYVEQNPIQQSNWIEEGF